MKNCKIVKICLFAFVMSEAFVFSGCATSKVSSDNSDYDDVILVDEAAETKNSPAISDDDSAAAVPIAIKKSEQDASLDDSSTVSDADVSSFDSYEADSSVNSTDAGSAPLNSSEKKNSNNLLSLFTKSKFVEYDETSVFTLTALGGLKQYTATMIYNQKEQTFGFGSIYMAGYYYVMLDSASRQAFINAVNTYIDDFAEKRLKRDYKKSSKIYGNISCSLNWGTVKSSTPSNGKGFAELGYKFKDKSPYFTITIPAVLNEYYKVTDTVSTESVPLLFYMTKAQALQLAKLLSDENVNSIKNFYIQEHFFDLNDSSKDSY